MSTLLNFIRESNRIEGILREPNDVEIKAHEDFMDLDQVTLDDLQRFVWDVAAARLRDKPGMNVCVGRHIPPAGSIRIRDDLEALLEEANVRVLTPYDVHLEYETLHPFMDGNGRSGRILWLWMMREMLGADALGVTLSRGFLHSFYYQTLDACDARK